MGESGRPLQCRVAYPESLRSGSPASSHRGLGRCRNELRHERRAGCPGYGLGVRIRPFFGDDRAVVDTVVEEVFPEVPRIPASAGALIFDEAGRLLILKPNYKKGWTVPGGQVDSDGESPWEACRRETQEECGLEVEHGRLVCVDFLRPKPNRPGGVRFLFHCGALTNRQLSAIRLEDGEIDAHRFVELAEAMALLSGPLRRRVGAALGLRGRNECAYLEDGRPR